MRHTYTKIVLLRFENLAACSATSLAKQPGHGTMRGGAGFCIGTLYSKNSKRRILCQTKTQCQHLSASSWRALSKGRHGHGGADGAVLGRLWPSWGVSVASMAFLGASWVVWGVFGASSGGPWAFGCVLGPSWGVLGRLGSSFGRSWREERVHVWGP